MWVDQAIAMVASLNEPSDQNPLAALTQQEGPQGRIYGSAPGAYGAGLQALMDSGSWDSRSDLGEAFLQWSQWNYGGSSEPSKDRKGLESALQRVQVVLHNQDNREHDLLDSDDYYQFHGGLSAAIEASSGKRPELWFGDHSRRERPRPTCWTTSPLIASHFGLVNEESDVLTALVGASMRRRCLLVLTSPCNYESILEYDSYAY